MNEVLRKVCRANLLNVLEKLKEHSDQNVVAQAKMAEGLFLDFESFGKTELQPGDANVARVAGDDTNYERYRLLRSYGLSPAQLVDIAKSDGLHDLRVIRMLRLTFELSLDEATKFVDSKT